CVDKLPAIMLPSSPLNDKSISPFTSVPNMTLPSELNNFSFPVRINLPFTSPVIPTKTPYCTSINPLSNIGLDIEYSNGTTLSKALIVPFINDLIDLFRVPVLIDIAALTHPLFMSIKPTQDLGFIQLSVVHTLVLYFN